MKKICLFLATSLLFSGIACADGITATDKAKIEALVKDVSKGQARAVEVFPGPHGLTGVVLKGMDDDSKKVIGWVTPGQQIVMIGDVYDRSGSNVNDEASIQILGETSRTEPSETVTEISPEDVFAQIKNLKGVAQFSVKEPTNTLYILFETNCWYCQRLHRELTRVEDQLKAEGLQVQWVPVGFEASSRERGAQVLTRGFQAMNEIGAPAPKESLDAVDNNSLAMANLMPKIATPQLFWQDKDGVHAIIGAPEKEDLQRVIKSLSTHPARVAKK